MDLKTEIICVGDELLIGQVVNTNASWLGEQLTLIGITCNKITVLPDRFDIIYNYIKTSIQQHNLVLITGGLGPTDDDLTKSVLCEIFSSSLVEDPQVLKDIEEIFDRFGKAVTERNKEQALVPDNCKVLYNKAGTAPGMMFESNEFLLFSLPGVPFELHYLFQKYIPTILESKYNIVKAIHHTILTIGIGESDLADLLDDFENNLEEDIHLAYLPSPGQVRLRLSLYKESKPNSIAFKHKINALEQLTNDYKYGNDNQTLEEIVGLLLKSNGQSLAIAESCSGGYLSYKVVSVPGASDYFKGSIVSYDNSVKISALEIPEILINQFGAVSAECVEAMARNVKKILKSDYGLSTSGLAGSKNMTDSDKNGLLFIGISGPKGTFSFKFKIGHSRMRFIEVTANLAMNILRKTILNDCNTAV